MGDRSLRGEKWRGSAGALADDQRPGSDQPVRAAALRWEAGAGGRRVRRGGAEDGDGRGEGVESGEGDADAPGDAQSAVERGGGEEVLPGAGDRRRGAGG